MNARVGALPDPDFEVLVTEGAEDIHPINSILIGLDPKLGLPVTLTLRDSQTQRVFTITVTEPEVDFDERMGNFVLSGNRVGGGRVNGRIYTMPDKRKVIGIVRLAL